MSGGAMNRDEQQDPSPAVRGILVALLLMVLVAIAVGVLAVVVIYR